VCLRFSFVIDYLISCLCRPRYGCATTEWYRPRDQADEHYGRADGRKSPPQSGGVSDAHTIWNKARQQAGVSPLHPHDYNAPATPRRRDGSHPARTHGPLGHRSTGAALTTSTTAINATAPPLMASTPSPEQRTVHSTDPE
jgi:hypothetical protein